MLRGIFVLIILIFLILSMLPIIQFATSKHERQDLRVGAINEKKVNIFDYNRVVTNLGKNNHNGLGDMNADGKIDLSDYNIVLSTFGNQK